MGAEDGKAGPEATANGGCTDGQGSAPDSPVSATADARAAAEASTPRVRRRGLGLQRKLSSFHDLPDYLKDNEYITHGYRSNLSFGQSLRSLFSLHNETGNVWSHLLGALFFVGLSIWLFYRTPTPMTLAHERVDAIWHQLQGSVDHLRENVAGLSGRLASQLPLPDGADLAGIKVSLGHLQAELAHKMTDLSAKAHTLGDGLAHKMTDLGDSLSASAHSLGDGIAHVREDVVSAMKSAVPERVSTAASNAAVEAQHQLEDGLAAAALQLATLRHYVNETIALHLHSAPHDQRLQWPTVRWPMYLFMMGAVICMLTSATCHLLGAMTQKYVKKVWKWDYGGIVTLIVSSFYPVIWYGFLCHPLWRTFHLTVITALGVATLCFTLFNRFQTQRFRSTRAFLFAILGLWGLIPLFHNLALNWSVHQVRIISAWELLMGAWYLVGATIFAWRVPERLAPGRFDRWGHSHQIFHLFVVMGALTHFYAAGLALQWRDLSGGCAAPVTVPVHDHIAALNASDMATHLTHEEVIEALVSRVREYTGLGQLDDLCSADVDGVCTWTQALAPSIAGY